MKLKDLKPNPQNPRRISNDQLERLKKSLAAFGDLSGFVYNRTTGQLVGGHQRAKAFPHEAVVEIHKVYDTPTDTGTTAQGYVTTPTGERFAYREVQWDAVTEKAANIAANQHGGEFDTAALTSWILELDAHNVDLDLTGFGDKELQDLMAPVGGLKDGLTEDDATPEPPKEAKSKRGELWTLGNHRLLIDDCTVRENVDRLMAGEKADMVFTDPPYNIASNGMMYAGAKTTFRKVYKDLTESDWDKNFKIEPALDSLLSIVAPSFTAYVCTSQFLVGDLISHIKERVHYYNTVVWCKTNPMPSLSKRCWTFGHELIVYFHGEGQIFNFPGEGHALSWWNLKNERHSEGHPTQKPVAVPEHAILHSSNPGMLVVDLFLGSGTTLVACEKTGRRCYGTEIEPLYADVILSRWAKYTGKDPVREDGAKWSEVNQ